ncbi:MAG: hypothetical protein NDJ89_15720 [Oligoflexia bacterium]|nr:hypothetical protein [Oligoflexia bacterium]
MREYTWNSRAADHHHHRRFKKLIGLHELTMAWVRELRIERAPHLLARGLSPDVADQLWVLDALDADSRLDPLLDDTAPEDVLGRLERTVWSVQAYTLSRLIEKTSLAEQPALEGALEQASWKLGRRVAEIRWKELPEEARADLRALVPAASGAPFLDVPEGEGLLVKRALRGEAAFEFLACPHRRSQFPDVASIASELCALHAQWLRGFAYGLNHRISAENAPSGARCGQRWRLHPA